MQLNNNFNSKAQLDQMKKKVSAYSKKIMELSIQIKESTMNSNTNLEDELNKLAILNEELQKKVNITLLIIARYWSMLGRRIGATTRRGKQKGRSKMNWTTIIQL